MKFTEFGFDDRLMEGIDASNYIDATPVQEQVIPLVMQGKDVIASAVLFTLAIPMLLSNMLGAYVGSKMAIKKGNEFIRIFFILVMILLLGKLGWDIFSTSL